jgi:hypothetical protein
MPADNPHSLITPAASTSCRWISLQLNQRSKLLLLLLLLLLHFQRHCLQLRNHPAAAQAAQA